jgi:AraC family transcriptional regulator of adaptative response / DNA-3-methyladenine glycosylase II
LWPSIEVLAGSDLQELKVPRARRDTVRNLAGALADQRLRLDERADGDEVREGLLALPGIGPWTASYIAMRALKDPDAFMATDLGVKRGAVALGLPAEPRALESYSQRWRPWRAYAVQYLWAAAELKGAR